MKVQTAENVTRVDQKAEDFQKKVDKEMDQMKQDILELKQNPPVVVTQNVSGSASSKMEGFVVNYWS